MSADDPLLIDVEIPGSLDPQERAALFEDPLAEVLAESGLGEVTGGGTTFSGPAPDDTLSIVSCSIDVDLFDVDEGLALLITTLRTLNAPPGTILEYALDGEDYRVDLYASPE